MSDGRRRLTTDEERARFAVATMQGGICVGCGRELGADDTVYVEQVAVDLKPLTAPGAGWSRKTVYRDAPLGRECASPAFLARMAGRESERCVGCDRPMYYAKERAHRFRATCSKRCNTRVTMAERS